MNLIVCKDETHWVRTVNSILLEKIDRYTVRTMFLPAGETPVPLYRDWSKSEPTFLKNLTLLQIDEILTGSKRGCFQNFFRDHLKNYVSRMEWIQSAGSTADLGLLGLGMNGHVAFHEPSLPVQFFSGCLTLDPITIERLELEPNTKAVTYGLNSIMRAKALVLLVRGESKRTILQQVLKEKTSLPATTLLEHKDLTIVTDFDLE